MGIVIGIDVGISTTKIVGISGGNVVSPMRIKATDPVTSLYGAFGKYLYDNKIQLTDVEHVMLTGVGSAYISKPVYGLPTDKAGEFVADGLGACHVSGKDHIIVVSMVLVLAAGRFRGCHVFCLRQTIYGRCRIWQCVVMCQTSTCVLEILVHVHCLVCQ